jgi:hypothetical protein
MKSSLLLIPFLVSGCIALNPGTIEAIKVVSEVKTVGDGLSAASTGKTLTDHAISKIVHKDCSTFHMFEHKNFCRVKVTYVVRNMQKRSRQKLSVETMQIINSFKEKDK